MRNDKHINYCLNHIMSLITAGSWLPPGMLYANEFMRRALKLNVPIMMDRWYAPIFISLSTLLRRVFTVQRDRGVATRQEGISMVLL